MIETVFYSLGSVVAILMIFHLLQVILSGVGGNTPAPASDKPSNDVCWFCHRVLPKNRIIVNLPSGMYAHVCPICAAKPGVSKYVV